MKYIKKFNTLEEQTAYLAEADIDTYLGYVDENDTVYYEDAIPERYDNKYFTIESTSDNNTIYLKATNTAITKTVSASTDNGQTWVSYTSSTGDSGTTLATLNAGDKLIIKGENSTYATSSRYSHFKTTGQFEVKGNVMSLVYGDNFSGQTTLTSGNTFSSLFYHCTELTSAENLVLPATTLANSCYEYMFAGCTSLTTAPELPATTLASWCYGNMFNGCTSLTTAPELPAATLASGCYYSMFEGCTNLISITCLATDISATNCTTGWVNGVAASGTFVKNAAMTGWTTGNNGIPSGWTVQDA